MKLDIIVVDTYDADLQMPANASLAIVRGEYGCTVTLPKCSEWVGEVKYIKSLCDGYVKLATHIDDVVDIDSIPSGTMIGFISYGGGAFVI